MSIVRKLMKIPGRLGLVIGLAAVIGAGAFLLDVSPARVLAAQSVTSQHEDYGRYTYADLAAKVIPSVVTVYVKHDITKSMSQRDLQQLERLREYFGDDLNRMFPGMPGPNDEQNGPDGPNGPNGPNGQGNEPLYEMTSGSGVIISADGYIITNWHVVGNVDEHNEITVVFSDDKELSGKDVKLVDSNELADLAVIKVDRKGLTPIKIGDSDTLRIGERVAAIGSPLDLRMTVTQGIVCAKGRQVDTGMSGLGDMIQTDAVINPGSSGGALVNLDGELVGINRLITSNTGRWQGYGFAIPSSDVKRFADEVMATGHAQYGFIGVQYKALWPSLKEAMGLDKDQEGMVVMGVTPGGPAEAAGLKSGDIIVSVDGKTIKESNDLLGYVARKKVGSDIKVEVLRPEQNGKVDDKTFTLTIKERDEKMMNDIREGHNPQYQEPQQNEESSPLLGMTVEPFDQDGVQGLRVTALDRRSDAARGGIRPGDVLTQMDGVKLSTVDDLKKAINDHPKDKAHWVQFQRDGMPQITTINVEKEQ